MNEHNRFVDDERVLKEFSDIAWRRADPATMPIVRTVDVLEWLEQPSGSRVHISLGAKQVDVSDLSRGPEPPLRVIFAPLDAPLPQTESLMHTLIDSYSIPPAFVAARLQAGTHACGLRSLKNGDQHIAWFQVLCKNINVVIRDERHVVVDPRGQHATSDNDSQAEGTWIKQKYFLSWGRGRGNELSTTLICFGTHPYLRSRFEHLSAHRAWRECVDSPYTLFVIILDELFQLLDGQVWKIQDVIKDLEKEILKEARSWNPDGQFDFVGLHNISKHISHLIESSSALFVTANRIHEASKAIPGIGETFASLRTTEELSYQKELIKSVGLRLTNLDKRLQNLVNLAFNLVTQTDSKVLQRDSDSMKSIAAVTLLFLPISTIATIFGTQFFSFEPGQKPELRVSGAFWMFWAISIPITFVVSATWLFHHNWTARRITGQKKRK